MEHLELVTTESGEAEIGCSRLQEISSRVASYTGQVLC